jgi:hypothetical protein
MDIRRAAACAVIAGALAVSLSAAAQAGDVVTVMSASSPATNPGLLSVVLESTTPVVQSSITAAMYPAASSSPALTVSDFTLTGGKNTGGTVTTWTVASPITTTQLPLGTYSITVTASDTGGGKADAQDIGTLAFVIYPTVTLSVTPAQFSYGQDVTLSGTDIGTYPGGATSPLAGQQIEFAAGPDTVTSSAGSFSVTVQAGIGAGDSLSNLGEYAAAEADATTAGATSAFVPTTVISDPVRLTGMTTDPAVVSYPDSFTISGTASYQSGGEWLAFGQQALTVSSVGSPLNRNGPPGFAGVTVTTADDGSFTAAIPAPVGPDEYSFGAAEDSFYSPWFSFPAPVVVPVLHVPLTGEVFAWANTDGGVYLDPCLDLNVPGNTVVDPAAMARYPDVRLQAAKSARGPWTTVATKPKAGLPSGPPDTVQGCFQTTVRATRSRAYFRVLTAATSNYPAFTSMAAKVIPAGTAAIRGFLVTPRTLRAGAKVHVSGKLYVDGQPGTGMLVQILFRADGSRKWQLKASVYGSAADGSFSAAFAVRKAGSIEARYTGSLYQYGARSPAVAVRVRG